MFQLVGHALVSRYAHVVYVTTYVYSTDIRVADAGEKGDHGDEARAANNGLHGGDYEA